MSVDTSTVSRIARLARIDIPDGELEPVAAKLTDLLDWIEQLNEVDTEKVEPLASVSGHALPMRGDEVTDGGTVEAVLANAPEGASGFFAVPKVVE